MKLFKPKNSTEKHYHCNDTFRELVDIWKELNLIEVIETETNFVWLEGIGKILLYDRPTLEWLDQDYKIGLFGNPDLPKNDKINLPWIFWGRNPRLLMQEYNNLRIYNTIFIGKIENQVQNKYRDSKWKYYIDYFELINGNKNKYEPKEYLNLLSQSKFGLCLRGFGPKCNREIELMALGVVPLITPEVSINYYNPLIEGKHYFKVNTPEDIPLLVSNCSNEQWLEMSNNCKKWYETNCSPKGSFNITMEIVKKNTLNSFCTLATKNVYSDLIHLLTSIEKYYSDIPIYILCDTFIENKIKDKYSNIKIYNKLDKYSNKNRAEMENDNIWTEFMLKKAEIIDISLEYNYNTLFVDSDIIFLDSNLEIDYSKEIGLSKHEIKEENIQKFGKYNGGFIYVSSKNFTKFWLEKTKSSRYMEQACLEMVPDEFTYFEFPINHNFGWWRLFESDNPEEIINNFRFQSKEIFYSDKKLNSIHTHLNENNNLLNVHFNNFLFGNKLNLVIQYYNDSNKKRQKELDICVIKNLNNFYIKKVINFKENATVVPDIIKNHPKYYEVDYNKRLTFEDAIKYSNNNLKNQMIILSNLDIYLDYNCNWNLDIDFVLGLSRYELNGKRDPNFNKIAMANTQDTWIFKSPLNIENCNFEIGSLGCDNAIAERINRSGKFIINCSNIFRTIHVDIIRSQEDKLRNYQKINYQPEKEGYYLLPVDSEYDKVKFEPIIKYHMMCDILNKYVKIK
jgi:hypothetical protein